MASSCDSQPCLQSFLRIPCGREKKSSSELCHWVTKLELCCHYGILDLAKDKSLVETDGYLSLFYRVNNVTFLCDNHLFFELIQNQCLQHLYLSLTFLSQIDVKLLCEVLNQAECSIEKLMYVWVCAPSSLAPSKEAS